MPFPYTLPLILGTVGELTPGDVERYTSGRLKASDPETARMLNAALVAARGDVGWHVSPVAVNQQITLDGPGGRVLRLPTQKIVKLTAITENGVPLDLPSTVVLPAEDQQVIWRKKGVWTRNFASITVTVDHGYTEDEAADWRQAILSIVDQMSTLVAVGRPDSELASKQIDDVVYRWNAAPMLPSVEPILASYRLLRFWI